MIVPATCTSSTQHNKADCSKCVICPYKVEKLMVCVKTRDCGLNTIFENRTHFVNTFRKCIDGAHGIGVQKVTSNCNVSTLISFVLYLVRRLASGETFILW